MTVVNHVLNRIHVQRLLFAAALSGLSLSAAAYVSPSPPPGFGGVPGSWTFTPPGAAEQVGKILRGPAPVLPGGAGGGAGGAVRLGGGAARALAGGVARSLIPGVGLALGLAWLASNCFEKRGGGWVRTCLPSGDPIPEPALSDGYEYRWTGSITGPWGPTESGACMAAQDLFIADAKSKGWLNPRLSYQAPDCKGFGTYQGVEQVIANLGRDRRTSACPLGWYVTPAGCVQQNPGVVFPPVTVEEIEEEMAPKPLPQQLPPGFPYPLDPTSPSIWNPDTATPPNSQPLRIPQGNPVPIPNTNPQQYRQPVTRWTHSPTPDDPWRMDVRPEDVVGTSPTGITGPQTVTSGSPAGKEPDKFDLCKEHPDIIACQKIDFDTPDGQIPKETKNVTFAAEDPFGGGRCPADVMASFSAIGGQSLKIVDWTTFCGLALPLRGLVLALAAIMAFFIIMPGGVRE